MCLSFIMTHQCHIESEKMLDCILKLVLLYFTYFEEMGFIFSLSIWHWCDSESLITPGVGPEKLKLECFVEALSELSSRVTYSALISSCKPSVMDTECIFNPNLSTFMHEKGYDYEAKFIQIFWNRR